jgi:hypothetical protein
VADQGGTGGSQAEAMSMTASIVRPEEKRRKKATLHAREKSFFLIR